MSPALGRRLRALAITGLLSSVVAGCGEPNKGGGFRMVTDSYSIRISPDPAPPRALEQVSWTVVVNDRETGKPIDAGQGRIFASSRDGKNIGNGFAPTEQVGTYTTKLFFVTAGSWAMGLEFRRDSLSRLERTGDWMQDVLSASEPGEFTLPSSTPTDTLVPDSMQRDSIRRELMRDSIGRDSIRRDSTSSEGAAAPR